MATLLELRDEIIAVAGDSRLQFSGDIHSFHWQIRDKKRVVADLWPASSKLRAAAIGNGTRCCGGNAQLLDLVKWVCKAYVSANAVAVETRPTAPATPARFAELTPTLPFADPAYRSDRYAKADMQLDGLELRLIINGLSFSHSVRLDPAETKEYVRKMREVIAVLEKLSGVVAAGV